MEKLTKTLKVSKNIEFQDSLIVKTILNEKNKS